MNSKPAVEKNKSGHFLLFFFGQFKLLPLCRLLPPSLPLSSPHFSQSHRHHLPPPCCLHPTFFLCFLCFALRILPVSFFVFLVPLFPSYIPSHHCLHLPFIVFPSLWHHCPTLFLLPSLTNFSTFPFSSCSLHFCISLIPFSSHKVPTFSQSQNLRRMIFGSYLGLTSGGMWFNEVVVVATSNIGESVGG